jgi:two-component system NtrC family sensor kinase
MAKATVARKAVGAGRRRAMGSVLVVDDEPDLSSTIEEILEASGYQVETAPDGAAALERLARDRFDLILSDVRMQGLDGPAFYQALEQQHPELTSRIVFMTGNILTDDTADFFAATGAPCLRKPFVTEDLHRVLQQVLTPAHA